MPLRHQVPTELRAARLAAGMTQARIAQATGLHVVTVSRIETGAAMPSWEVVDRWASACGKRARIVLESA